MAGGQDGNEILSRKYFQKDNKQVIDGFLVPTDSSTLRTSDAPLPTASVEYYFDFLTDHRVDQELACKSLDIFNKSSYYIDIDFDCEKETTEVAYYDIYGVSTEPEICQE